MSNFEIEYKMQHIVIVGGSGFVGRHLIKKLLEQNYKVTIFDIISPDFSIDESVEFHKCDVREPIRVNLHHKPDAVINLAAVHKNPGHDANEYYLTNVLGALNLCEWARRNGIKRNIFVSSISVYGDGSTNETSVSYSAKRTDYGFSKFLAESIYLENCKELNTNLTIFRPAVIFGEGENGNFTRLARALAKSRFFIPSTQPVFKPCGYVKDFVEAIAFSLSSTKGSTFYNFAFPQKYTIQDICQGFHEIGGFAMPPRLPFQRILKPFINKFPKNDTLARISKLLAGQKVIPMNLIQEDFNWSFKLNDALHDWKVASNFDKPPSSSS